MTIKCDKEGIEAIQQLGDVALRAGGNSNLQFVTNLYTKLELIEEPATIESDK